MFKLDAQLRKPLCELIGNAFNADELAMVVRFNLGEKIEKLIPSNLALDAAVFELVETTERHGTLEMLLRGIVKARPKSGAVYEFFEKYKNLSALLGPLDTGALVNAVNAGLKAATTNATADPAFGQTVGGFRADFNTAREQVRVLKRYKVLHDSLHNLQMRLPTIILFAAKPLSDRAAANQLVRDASYLRRLVDEASTEAKELPNERVEFSTWINDFDDSVTKLQAAFRLGGSAAAVTDAVNTLIRLPSEASRINGQLTQAAGNVRLDNLVAALKSLATAATGAVAAALEDGRDALALLRPQLGGFVVEHMEWQGLDRALTAGEASLELKPHVKVPRWLDVKQSLEKLCDLKRQEQWSQQLHLLIDTWEGAAAADPPDDDATDRAFLDFRSACTSRFFVVDAELRVLCERLDGIAAPLDTLLGVIS